MKDDLQYSTIPPLMTVSIERLALEMRDALVHCELFKLDRDDPHKFSAGKAFYSNLAAVYASVIAFRTGSHEISQLVRDMTEVKLAAHRLERQAQTLRADEGRLTDTLMKRCHTADKEIRDAG